MAFDNRGEDLENETARPETGRPATRGPRDLEEALLKEIPARAEQANPRLREQLTGTLLLELSDVRKKYLLDWREEKLKVKENGGGDADCKMYIKHADLWKIFNGTLNPQIAMLSEKIKIEGKLSLAIYLFNLMVPNR